MQIQLMSDVLHRATQKPGFMANFIKKSWTDSTCECSLVNWEGVACIFTYLCQIFRTTNGAKLEPRLVAKINLMMEFHENHKIHKCLAHVIEQQNFQIPNLQYLQRKFESLSFCLIKSRTNSQ